jgi:glycosyltransferase involved in cell wall biosynthesis
MPLTVLNVAYPFAPVGPEVVGGAEQILHAIDRRLVDSGHTSIVIACEGSQVRGHLIATPAPRGVLDERAHAEAAVRHRRAIDRAFSHAAHHLHTNIDIVHLHGLDFDRYFPPSGVPVLCTLHLPPELLRAQLDLLDRPGTWVHGVSHAQQPRIAYTSPRVHLLPPIENGVAVRDLPRAHVRRRRFALALGRICPEKGLHLALEAAQRAKRPIVVGGMVFPYADHQRYFARELLPRISREHRFVGPVSIGRKRRLLNAASCVLVPSQIAETSSLVAMEALACGTPVIAFAAGALPEIVEHGVTGFIVRDVQEMAEAMQEADRIDPDACRAAAWTRFSADRMVAAYIERYERILIWSRTATSPDADASARRFASNA